MPRTRTGAFSQSSVGMLVKWLADCTAVKHWRGFRGFENVFYVLRDPFVSCTIIHRQSDILCCDVDHDTRIGGRIIYCRKVEGLVWYLWAVVMRKWHG